MLVCLFASFFVFAANEKSKEEQFFDKEYYLKNYKDKVEKSKLSPFEHFMKTGWKEDLNPNSWFQAAVYKKYFPCDGNPFSNFLNQPSGVQKGGHEKELIMSLTTQPKRLDYTWLAVESALRQTLKPNRVILWIAKDEIPDIDHIPESLKILQERGLEIRFVDENLKPGNKLLHTAKEFPDAAIHIMDDDHVYKPNNLKGLYEAYLKNKDCICAYDVYTVFVDNKLVPLSKMVGVEEDNPKIGGVCQGYGGALYSPKLLDERATDLKLYKKLSLTNDDGWYGVMALLKNTKIINVKRKYDESGVRAIDEVEETPKLCTYNRKEGYNRTMVNMYIDLDLKNNKDLQIDDELKDMKLVSYDS